MKTRSWLSRRLITRT